MVPIKHKLSFKFNKTIQTKIFFVFLHKFIT